MSSSTIVVEAELREQCGRSAARRLRRQGKVPGIIYGGGKPDLPIAMDYVALSRLVEDEHFHASMLEMKVKGAGKQNVLLKDIQWDPVKDTVIHIDFQRVSASDQVTIEVPVVPVNYEKCPGVVAGGIVELVRHELEITCRADAIPEHIEVDCSNLEIGDTIHIDDIKLPEGVEVHHEVNFTILNIAPPNTGIEKVSEETEGEAGEGGNEAE